MHTEGTYIPAEGRTPPELQISRRDFVKTAATGGAGLLMFGAMERQALAAPEIERSRSWRGGAQYLKRQALYGINERLSVFVTDSDKLVSLDTPGEWLTERIGDNSSVSGGDAVPYFIEQAIIDGKRMAVHCHTHPNRLPDPSAPAEKIPRRGIFQRKPKQYGESMPPSFFERADGGDAVSAFYMNRAYADKIDVRHRVFDPRGMWKYSVDSKHQYWQDFGELMDEYDVLTDIMEQDENVAPILQGYEKGRDSMREVILQTIIDSQKYLDKGFYAECQAFLRKYDECLVAPYESQLYLRDIVLNSYMDRSKTQPIPAAGMVQKFYQKLGVNIEFEPYEAMGL